MSNIDNLTSLVGTVAVLGMVDHLINKRSYNNKTYKLLGWYSTKVKATTAANGKKNKGYSARVRKESKGYSVYYR